MLHKIATFAGKLSGVRFEGIVPFSRQKFVSYVRTFEFLMDRSFRALQTAILALSALASAATQALAQAQPVPNQLQSAVWAVDAAGQGQPSPTLQYSATDRDNGFIRFFRDAEWYFSWGYNKEYWSPTDIHVSQPALGNSFTIHDVRGTDEFSLGEIFSGFPFGPQYNIRIGRFIDDARTFGVELSVDHSKYNTTLGQTALVMGTVGGLPTNANYQLNNNVFSEVLHNGANHVMINAVYRYPLIGQTNETLSVAGIAKAGAGIMLPHTTDTIFGYTNDVGNKTFGNAIGFTNGWWQLNGVTSGVEVGFRVVLYKPVYLELTDKVAYSYYGDLPAYMGTLQQSQWMNEIVLSIGFTYDGTSK